MLLPFQLFYHSYGFYQKTLSQHHDDSGVCTIKNEMKTSLQRRLADAEENEKLLVATIMDSRFKEKFFSGPVVTVREQSLECKRRYLLLTLATRI